MEKILCPTDSSPVAQNAILYASEFAQRSGASLILFHSEFFPQPVTSAQDEGEKNDENEELINLPTEYIPELKEKFDCLLMQLRLNYPGVKYKYIVEEGLVIENIARYANKNKIDMVIMGTSGASGFQALLEGCNSVNVMEKVNCPVLIIPEKVEYKVPRSFVYATDLRENEEEIVRALLGLTKLFDANLELLHFEEEERDLLASENSLQSLITKFSAEQLSKNIMLADASMDAIEEYAKSNADILVLAHRKQNFLEKLFSRSNAEKIAYNAEVPLLVMHKP